MPVSALETKGVLVKVLARVDLGLASGSVLQERQIFGPSRREMNRVTNGSGRNMLLLPFASPKQVYRRGPSGRTYARAQKYAKAEIRPTPAIIRLPIV